MRYINGTDRHQSLLLPEMIDEYIDRNNAVRFIDAFVDSLDIPALGFTHSRTSHKGRKPYNPADLLKLYIYGYLHKIRSSRQLEKATYYNIETIWLLRKLRPDFKTIADFRKDNSQALKGVCREFIMLCKAMDLFGSELIAIDGSKFSAVNHNGRNYTKAKLNKILQAIEQEIDSYFKQLQQQDDHEADLTEPQQQQVQQKIKDIQQRREQLQQLQQQLAKSDDAQLSLTDKDSRMMKTTKGNDVSYNVQLATDAKHKLIVEFEVTNDMNDLNQLSNMATNAKNTLAVSSLTVTADAGYHNEVEVAKCEQQHITCYIPKPRPKSTEHNEQLFTKANFNYDAATDCYYCPANQPLGYSGRTRWKNKKKEKIYRCSEGKSCPLRSQCTNGKRIHRHLHRGVDEHLIEQMQQRVQQSPHMVSIRKELVEHPFGTIKHWMDQGYFLTRGFEHVTGEMSLTVLCYNMKRVLNIIDVKELIRNVQQWLKNHYFLFQFKFLGFIGNPVYNSPAI